MFAILSLLSICLPTVILDHNLNFGEFFQPEVIDNRARANIVKGYQYPIPEVPVNFDEPTSSTPFPVSSTYLPPPPQNVPPIYDNFPPENAYLPYSLSKTPNVNFNTEFKIVNMSCIDSPSLKFFRATIQTGNALNFPPIVEDGTADCVSGSGKTFNLNFEAGKLQQCGVRRCGNGNLCAKLRIATVRGLRLADDVSVVLLCKPQEAVASHVKSIKLNPRIVQGRALSPVASGGTQRKFDTEVALYRRVSGVGDFTDRVIQGSSVQLGEDLLLKAIVREGDGWNYSKMGAVIMERPSGVTTSVENSVTLVDETGCRPQNVKSVCPGHPNRIGPLVTVLPFRAFMFQDSNPGDEMVLSVRLYGCVQFDDCAQPMGACEEEKVQQRLIGARFKRETKNRTRSGHVSDWHSYLEFRVVLPEVNRAQDAAKNNENAVAENEALTLKPLTITAWVAGTACALIFAVMIMTLIARKIQRRN